MQKLYTETGGLPLESTDFLYAATIFSRVEVVVFLEVLRVVSMDVKLGFCTKPTVLFKTHLASITQNLAIVMVGMIKIHYYW